MKKLYIAIIFAIFPFFSVYSETVPSPIEVGEPDGEYLGHQYVDLALPSGTLWAVSSIGTDIPEGIGHYFSWGGLEPRDLFTYENYEYSLGWQVDETGDYTWMVEDIGDNISGTQYDAATYHWGEGWRMPTNKELSELELNCREDWYVSLNGMPGSLFIGRNGHKIFFPCSGEGKDYPEDNTHIGLLGHFWTASRARIRAVHYFYAHAYSSLCGGEASPCCGAAIRPVLDSATLGINALPSGDSPGVSVSYQDGNITILGEDRPYTLKVSDIYGSTVALSTVQIGSNLLPGLAKGIYLLSLYQGNALVKAQKIAVK